MIHLGDIQKLDGHKLPIVDIITGGSPCQNLSVAGNRKGLEGEQSSLFLEQIRIIKEMREECERTNVVLRPRYMVWENVTGAFSSNKGEDFRRVLEETARIADKAAVIPRFEGGCGQQAAVSWEIGGQLLGEYTTRSFGEYPREENVSHLSQILEDTPHPKYYLSEKACAGILRRAKKRGKNIPPELENALKKQCSVFKETASTEPTPPDATEKAGQKM